MKNFRNKRGSKKKASTGEKIEIKQMVRSMINSQQEVKEFSFTGPSSAAWATAGAVYPITQNVIQGDDITQRSGDMIILRRFQNNQFLTGSVVATSNVVGRVILFYDSMSSGSLPAVTDVLDTASYLSGYNNFNKQRNRFQVISDISYSLLGLTNLQLSITDKVYKSNKHIYFNGSTNANSSLGKNQLYALYISNNALGSYSAYFTLAYTDS